MSNDETGTVALSGQCPLVATLPVSAQCDPEFCQKALNLLPLEFCSRLDGLTVLPNRRAFLIALDQAMAERPLQLVLLDIDRFGDLNACFGMAVGDRLLTEVGGRLASLQSPDRLVACLGGDMFATVEPLAPAGPAIPVLVDKLSELLTSAIDIDDTSYFLTSSFGLAQSPKDGATASALLEAAEAALAEGKRWGRGSAVTFRPEFVRDRGRAAWLAQGLQRALEGDRLQVVYQPQIELRDSSIFGFEALVRWTDEAGQAVSPTDFIPVAEQTGLITRLGAVVMTKACQFGAEIRRKTGRPLTIAVNVSAVQLHRHDFLATVERALKVAGLPPEALEIELTERALLEANRDAVAVLAELRRWGVVVSLDDFGTGYSSLGCLTSLPIDRIKLDRSFIEQLPRDFRSVEVVLAVLRLARSLSIDSLAEGIEGAEQAEFLRRCGCRRAQGYHFGRPEPAEAFLSGQIRF